MAFNVETYQITKKNKQSTSGGTEGVSQEVLDRLSVLEENQNNILGDYYFDFEDDRFIDLYKSTIIKSNNYIIPRQYTNLVITGLDKNDDCIDYDKSTGIKYHNNHVSLINVSVLSGELYLFPIEITKGSIGMKFHSNYSNKSTTGKSDTTKLSSGMLWFTSGVDPLGRLWVFRTSQYNTSDTKAYLEIYDTDMKLIRSTSILKSLLLNGTDYNHGLFYNASNMLFTNNNTCLLVVRRSIYARNGLGRDYTWSNAFDDNSMTDLVIEFKDDGTRINSGVHGRYYFVNNTNYPYHHYGSSPSLLVAKNQTAILMGGTYAYRSYYQSNDSYINRNLMGIDLRDPSSSEYKIKRCDQKNFPNTLDGKGDRWVGNSIIQSNMFTRNSYFYNFVTSNKRIDSGDKISWIYNFQCGYDVINNKFYSDSDENNISQVPLLDEAEDPIVIYSHPGFNGMYYNTSNNKLYIFGNGQDAVGTIRCYDMDWTSRINGKLKVKKVLQKDVNLKASSWGSISNDTTMVGSTSNYYPTYAHRGYHSNPWEYMKIVNFKDSLHLFYFAPQSNSETNLCLKYMSMDYELNIIVDETILNRQNDGADVSNRISHYEVNIVNDELVILVSYGNSEEYSTDTSSTTNANSLKTIQFFKINIVESVVKFYYMNEINNTWIEIQNNDTVLFEQPLDYVRIKSVLKAGNYGCSPRIDDFTIQSWNNNNEELRWSEYYSNKIDCLQGNGKAVLHVEQDAGDGVINWFISFDGGKTYSAIELDEEFAYTHLEAVDCRLKALIGVKDNSDKIPKIYNYTIKTKHIVFHTDLEEIQINLIKTNFKIDTYASATKNGLLKMTIDTLSDDTNIDKAKSDCTYQISNGSISGNYMQTNPEDVTDNIKTVLLVVDEKLEEDSKIIYYVSIDGGLNFKEVTPNIKTQVTNVNSNKSSLVIKAVFEGRATLSAWGIAWN